jgi:hypothetical protein
MGRGCWRRVISRDRSSCDAYTYFVDPSTCRSNGAVAKLPSSLKTHPEFTACRCNWKVELVDLEVLSSGRVRGRSEVPSHPALNKPFRSANDITLHVNMRHVVSTARSCIHSSNHSWTSGSGQCRQDCQYGTTYSISLVFSVYGHSLPPVSVANEGQLF